MGQSGFSWIHSAVPGSPGSHTTQRFVAGSPGAMDSRTEMLISLVSERSVATDSQIHEATPSSAATISMDDLESIARSRSTEARAGNIGTSTTTDRRSPESGGLQGPYVGTTRIRGPARRAG